MKIKMLLACVTFIASFKPLVFAQNVYVMSNEHKLVSFADTLVLKLSTGNKILFIGSDFKEMKNYTSADSIKTLFMNDLDQALSKGQVNAGSQKIYYFVHGNGKRRLKAENPEYNENSVDVGYEIKRLNLDLPKYEYHLYDLEQGYVLQVYLTDPAQLKNVLGETSIDEAIRFAKSNAKTVLKRTYKAELSIENDNIKFDKKAEGHSDAIELTPAFGVGLLGNTFAPVVGFDLWLRLTNRYSVSRYRMGLGLTAFPFVNTVGREITSVDFVRSYDLKFAVNINSRRSDDPHWLGLQGGFTNSNEIRSFNNAYKFGVSYEGKGPFNYSFDLIKDANKNSLYGFTIKLPF